VARLLGHLEPDLVLHTGDVVYPAGQERHYDRRFFAPYRNLI
jgi:3',5'-cyclic AMP phosphodiesterase CpdA